MVEDRMFTAADVMGKWWLQIALTLEMGCGWVSGTWC